MGKWTARLAEKISAPPSAPTDETAKRGVLSVLAVTPEGVQENFHALPMQATGPDPLPAGSPPRPYRLSQADADAAHAEPWDEPAIGRFVARVSLFLRRGIGASDADDLAERLHLRDVQGDDRRCCLECAHLAGRRCGNARVAGVGADLPAAIVTRLQHCPGFAEVAS